MLTDQNLITINVAGIVFLLVIMTILIAATRFKGGAGWVALVIVTTTVPMYLANLMRDLGSEYFLWFLYPAITLNVLCVPALWFFVRSQLDKSFRITWRSLLHIIPAVVSLIIHIIYYAPLSAEQIVAEMQFMETGKDNLPANINNVLVWTQVIIYFPLMIRYIRKRMKYLQNNFSDSDYFTIRWIPGSIIVFFGLFIAVIVTYVISPRTDTWLIPILNVIAMSYFVYNVIFHSTAPYVRRLTEMSADVAEFEGGMSSPAMDVRQMKEICEQITAYLTSSAAYTSPDFSLPMLAVETGISPKNISRAINAYLNKNFFELINEMRVNEAKKMLSNLDDNYTIDSVAGKCGFRSRSTFYSAFKKVEGKTPAQWMRNS